MATAHAAHLALVNAPGSSQFGQFRLTQFVSAQRPSNATSDATTTTTTTPSTIQLQDVEQMAHVPRPSSGQNKERFSVDVPARSTPQNLNTSNSSPRGLGQLDLVQLTSNPVIEGILGPNKDGRVRNPVPSKLKGKTDKKQGNFGVMHMGTSPGKKTEAQGRDSAAERDAAARRTSENTASRAKAAQQEKYIPPKKRGIETTLNDPASRGSPFAVSKNDDRNRARPLAPDETKYEQARLLTLLRSINPVTVVDQICKAVAYFGGIPGAPPPEDGIFPESANTRETGALFIGWVAEIFPDLSSRSPDIATKDTSQDGTGKRKGRPSTGKKSMPSNGQRGASTELPNSRNGYGYGPAVSAPAWGLPASLALVNTPTPVPAVDSLPAVQSVYTQNKPAENTLVTPTKAYQEDVENTSTTKRRRGRPKGSRNKASKADGQPGGDIISPNKTDNSLSSNTHPEQNQRQSLEATSTTAQNVASLQNHTALPAATTKMSVMQTDTHKEPQNYQYTQPTWPSDLPKNQGGQGVVSSAEEFSPEERAVLEALRHPASDMRKTTAPVIAAPSKEAMATETKKRKRAPTKPKENPPTAKSSVAANPPADSFQPAQNPSTYGPSNPGPALGNKDSIQWSTASPSIPNAPPAKKPRHRKPKPSGASEPPSRTQTASVVSSTTPTIPPSTIPDSQATVSQQSLPVSRPPAEGLEAHYERFAKLQQSNMQQNGRSNTPTQLQQQQQARQPSKPTPQPPQQSTPQIQHQQMQQQKSQQGSQQNHQREDQKLSQGASTRQSSSATYYNNSNQRSQTSTSYGQQYPSHQPSQLYAGHQPSPQLSNSTYRGSSAHTLGQASPQFSHPENSYRTSTPHTIAQPSPSFSQTESNFRASSAHGLAQPTASYSQAETTYRAPTAHSLAQQQSSYPSSRTQSHPQTQASHQSHYNHFSDSSYIDLPTLESLGHSGTSSNAAGVGMSTAGYAQGLGVGLGGGGGGGSNSNNHNNSSNSTSRATSGPNNSLYGTAAFDTGANDLLRGIPRSGSNNASAMYGTTPAGLSGFDTTGAGGEQDMRERLLRGLGRR